MPWWVVMTMASCLQPLEIAKEKSPPVDLTVETATVEAVIVVIVVNVAASTVTVMVVVVTVVTVMVVVVVTVVIVMAVVVVVVVMVTVSVVTVMVEVIVMAPTGPLSALASFWTSPALNKSPKRSSLLWEAQPLTEASSPHPLTNLKHQASPGPIPLEVLALEM